MRLANRTVVADWRRLIITVLVCEEALSHNRWYMKNKGYAAYPMTSEIPTHRIFLVYLAFLDTLCQLFLSFPSTFGIHNVLPMCVEWIAHRLRTVNLHSARAVLEVRTLTLWLCSSKQYPIRRENISLTSGPYPVFCPPHSIQPFSCTIRPSITPSRIAFPTIYSASSSESRCNLTHISRSEMRE
jgi:hypothetical protein